MTAAGTDPASSSDPGAPTVGAGERDGPTDEGSGDEGPGDEGSPSSRFVETIDTGRWRGISAMALLAGGLGVGAHSPGLLLAAFVGVVYLGIVRASEPPTPDLSVERTVSDASPDPGDTVTVRVRVRNEGDGTLTDLRLVDGVPTELVVEGGSPRHGTVLRPGRTASFEYRLTAKRGRHRFDGTSAIVRGLAGATEDVYEFDAPGEITCLPPVEADATVPLRQLTSQYTGRVDTDTGGEGVEFFATREYRPGDSLSRVDWNRYARRRELSTLTFREERMATVVLLLDLRRAAYVRASEEDRHAPALAMDAAGRLFGALLDAGDRVGIAGVSMEDLWLAPGTGNDHRARAQELLATHPALSPVPPASDPAPGVAVATLQRRLPADAQVIFLSPMVDDGAHDIARRLDAYGHLVTVISADATADETTADRAGRLRRTLRLSDLRSAGIRVVDWERDERLASAVERAGRRWSP